MDRFKAIGLRWGEVEMAALRTVLGISKLDKKRNSSKCTNTLLKLLYVRQKKNCDGKGKRLV